MRAYAAIGACLLACAATAAPRSGYQDASPETRAIQDDDTANPAFLWVLQGEAAWSAAAGDARKSCRDCHGDATRSMRGVAARYPAFDPRLGRVVTLTQKINDGRLTHQGAAALAEESSELLALAAYIGLQSRGMPVSVTVDGPAAPSYHLGKTLFTTRFGQLDLACAECHDQLAGKHLAGSVIPEGHPNGYPLYRLEWQTLGSLSRRIRNCMTGVRAEPFAPSSEEMTALQLFLAARATGLAVETPAVRP